MITDAILQYAGEELRRQVLDRVLVQKIAVWGRASESPFISMRLYFLPTMSEMQTWGMGTRGGEEYVQIPGEVVGPLDEEATKCLLRWQVSEMARRAEKRAARLVPQEGVLEVTPLAQLDRAIEPNEAGEGGE